MGKISSYIYIKINNTKFYTHLDTPKSCLSPLANDLIINLIKIKLTNRLLALCSPNPKIITILCVSLYKILVTPSMCCLLLGYNLNPGLIAVHLVQGVQLCPSIYKQTDAHSSRTGLEIENKINQSRSYGFGDS